MTWGWGESGRRNQFIKYAAINGMIRSALVQYSAYESIKTHRWWYQSIISACSVNSYFKQHQHQYADNKINAQSINSQCTEHLQAIHKASASNECKINISALSININAESSNIQWAEHHHAKHSVFISKADSDSVQCTLCQQPLNATLTSMRSSSTSMLRVSTASVQNLNNQRTQFQQPMNATSMHRASTSNAQSINNQCALHQQPMRIAPDSLMLDFSSTKTFILCSKPPTPVILRRAEGEVAESILPESTLSNDVWRDPPQSPFSLCERSKCPT